MKTLCWCTAPYKIVPAVACSAVWLNRSCVTDWLTDCHLPPRSVFLYKYKADWCNTVNTDSVEECGKHNLLYTLSSVFTSLCTWLVAAKSGCSLHILTGFGESDILGDHQLVYATSPPLIGVFPLLSDVQTAQRDVLKCLLCLLSLLNDRGQKWSLSCFCSASRKPLAGGEHVEWKCIYQKVNYRCLWQNSRYMPACVSTRGKTCTNSLLY